MRYVQTLIKQVKMDVFFLIQGVYDTGSAETSIQFSAISVESSHETFLQLYIYILY